MYYSHILPGQGSYQTLVGGIEKYIIQKGRIRSKVFHGRFVRLDRYLEANQERKDRTQRLQCFWIALDCIRSSEATCSTRSIRGTREFEIIGVYRDGVIAIHIREEFTKKGKELFLISTFPK